MRKAAMGFVVGVATVVACGKAGDSAEADDGTSKAVSATREVTFDVCGTSSGGYADVGDVWVVQADVCRESGDCYPADYRYSAEESDIWVSCGSETGTVRVRYLIP